MSLPVRIFLSWAHESTASSEVVPDPQSALSKLSVQPAMKLSLPSASRALVRLGHRLQSLLSSLKEWVPEQSPALVPIAIRTGRHTRGPVGRRPYRGG